MVPQYYLDRELLPREILLPLPVEDMDTLSVLLTERCGHTVTLRVPQRGQRRELLDIACRNAKEEVERVTSDTERTAGILRLLQELAGLPVLPAAWRATTSPTPAAPIRWPAWWYSWTDGP